ncbi:hypothetical protein D1164_03915 [Mariniphaga sediminis]|uniref:Uncharacterized protein n=1 Tax=Mariniphaga sediminis TaxID=1628158 RepID=A0A399D9D3_9BACT|nr:hypothetical protein D1164_03915 [Mariniphaga sediminis]
MAYAFILIFNSFSTLESLTPAPALLYSEVADLVISAMKHFLKNSNTPLALFSPFFDKLMFSVSKLH